MYFSCCRELFLTSCNALSYNLVMNKSLSVPKSLISSWEEHLQLIAELFSVPAALIMRLEEDNIGVFASSGGSNNPYRVGESEPVWESGLYCERVLKTRRPLEVPDALADPEWMNNPDIPRNMISYLGFPILLSDNTPFGTICVLDSEKRSYSTLYKNLLATFRDMVQQSLELVYINSVLGESRSRVSDYLDDLLKLKGIVSICAVCKDIKDFEGKWHPVEDYLIGHPRAQFSHGICPDCFKKY